MALVGYVQESEKVPASTAYDVDVGTLHFDRSGQWRHGVINLHVSHCEYDMCLSIRFMIDR